MIQSVIAKRYDRTLYTGGVLVGQLGVWLEFGLHSARGILDFGDFFSFFSFFPGIFWGALAFVIARLDFWSFIMVIHNLKNY